MAPALSHSEWLQSMHAAHAAHCAQLAGVAPSPGAAPMTSFSSSAALPQAPSAWQEAPVVGGAAGMVDAAFSGISIEDCDDFDAPVYRSISDVDFSSASWGTVEEEDEAPVYRSLDFAPAPAPAAQAMSPEEAERVWLESMPPLISRQRARGGSVLGA